MYVVGTHWKHPVNTLPMSTATNGFMGYKKNTNYCYLKLYMVDVLKFQNWFLK